jgi:hypothetical protein
VTEGWEDSRANMDGIFKGKKYLSQPLNPQSVHIVTVLTASIIQSLHILLSTFLTFTHKYLMFTILTYGFPYTFLAYSAPSLTWNVWQHDSRTMQATKYRRTGS